MLMRSCLLVWLTLGLQVATAVLNVSGILTAKYLNSVHRLLLDSLRSAVVWAFGLWMHCLWDGTSMVGEPWTLYSYFQMGGFCLMVFGQLVYGDLIVLPCFKSCVLPAFDCNRTSTPTTSSIPGLEVSVSENTFKGSSS